MEQSINASQARIKLSKLVRMSIENLLRATPEEIKSMEKFLKKSKEELREDVDILKEWWGKQPHLPHLTPDDDKILFNTIVCNKYRIEKCKMKIDYYYSIPHIYPELFKDRQPLTPRMKNAARSVLIVPLPRLASDFGRITIYRFPSDDSGFDPEAVMTKIFTIGDFRMQKDNCLLEHSILDMENFTFSRVLALNPFLLSKLLTITQKGYSFIIGSIHITSIPAGAVNIINFAKSMLKEKFKARIYVHEKGEDVLKYFPKDIIPKDYGGEEKSLEELNDEWTKMLESHNSFFEDMEKRQSKEELRIGKPLSDEFLGLQGTFRQLNVD